MNSLSRMRSILRAAASHEFQNRVATLFGELDDDFSESKRLGLFDQMGIDAYAPTSSGLAFGVVVQCKGFEVLSYGQKQHLQCRSEIAKYRAKGAPCEAYWLAINRPITDRSMRNELKQDLAGLVKDGLAKTTELLDLNQLVEKIQSLCVIKLNSLAGERRIELFDYYAERMRLVNYIRAVPFDPGRAIDPVSFLTAKISGFFGQVRPNQAGRRRAAPQFLISSEFGFGKTSTLQAFSHAWVQSGRQVIYVPAALIGHRAFANASGLTQEIMSLLMAEEPSIDPELSIVFRESLREVLASSKEHVLIVDGLDENEAAFRPTSLETFRRIIGELGVPVIMSARDELVELRRSELFDPQEQRHSPSLRLERLQLLDWETGLIGQFVARFAEKKRDKEPSSFQKFRSVIQSGHYNQVYGDIPKRPLFLGMLAEDAWSGQNPETQLHRLYGKYIRQKFSYDRAGIASYGLTKRPSDIVSALGKEESAERLILVMQDAAGTMLEITEEGGFRGALHRETISESLLRGIAATRNLPFERIEDVAMHSLLQPAGRDDVTRERRMRFAHRSFQEWFLARKFAATGEADYLGLQPQTRAFLEAMSKDLAAGGTLP